MYYKKVDTYQYYYRDKECTAANKKDKSCICWHDEGTGPYAHVKLDHRADGLIPANFDGKGFVWRIFSKYEPVEVLEVSKLEVKKADSRTEISARCTALIADLLETATRADLSDEDAQAVERMLRLGLYMLEHRSLRSE